MDECLYLSLAAESDTISIGSSRSNQLYDGGRVGGRDPYGGQVSATESSREDNYRDFDTESDISSTTGGKKTVTFFVPFLDILYKRSVW